jgi:hydroxymethylglutaryl-CoA lyase
MIKINESPRDAMQALSKIISTQHKVEYIDLLLKVGFQILDLGSFVSPNAVPQMKDTADVLKKINTDNIKTEISVLVGNSYYAEKLSEYEQVDYINYPFSISEKFQRLNLKAGFEKSVRTIDNIIELCIKTNKKPIISISEAFGNPYDDDWGIDILMEWIEILYEKGLRYIPLADTTASGSTHLIGLVYKNVIPEFPDVEFNLHLHSNSSEALLKIENAYISGCRNFDTVFNGMGGCPMTGKEPVANLNTLDFVNWLDKNKIEHTIKNSFFEKAIKKAAELF